MAESRKLVSTKEAAKAIGVCGLTLRTWALAGKIPSYRSPGDYRPRFKFDVEEVRRALAMNGAR